jgi:hypothetical protein
MAMPATPVAAGFWHDHEAAAKFLASTVRG